jgi:hypothetical protein
LAAASAHDSHGHGHGHGHGIDRAKLLRADNINMDAGAGGLSVPLMGAGALGLVATLGAGFAGIASLKHAIAVYHAGAMAVLGICLGSMFFVMAFHLTNAGWASTIRRTFENVMSYLPIAFLLVLPVLVIEIATQGRLFTWLSPASHADYLLQKKWAFFYWPMGKPKGGEPSFIFPLFFALRAAIYGVVWTVLSRRLLALSKAQDNAQNIDAAAQARRTSAWGMLLFALTTAFAGFDWLMSVDFKFFSTMWGVYFFAGANFAAVATTAALLAWIRSKRKLEGVVTNEHFHDLGKLMFSFTVFWAYISFSQYFLIWYSNIPEETAFYLHRYEGGWRYLGYLLIAGHFFAPFLILIHRPVKRTPAILLLLGGFMVLIHAADLYWVVRPAVYSYNQEAETTPAVLSTLWLDLIAVLGALALMLGFVLRQITRNQLVPAHDAWINDSLEHKNYV